MEKDDNKIEETKKSQTKKSWIALIFKGIYRFFIGLLLLLMTLVVLLSIPSFQTLIGSMLTAKLKSDLCIDISIDKLYLSLEDEEEIHGLLIRDHRQDTLFYVKKLVTELDFQEIYQGKYNLNKADIDGFKCIMKVYESEDRDNLSKWIDLVSPKKKEDTPSTFKLNGNINLSNSEFWYIDQNKKQKPVQFNAQEINGSLERFNIAGAAVKSYIKGLRFITKSNNNTFRLKNLDSEFSYTKQKISLQKLKAETAHSKLRGNLTISPDKKRGYSDFYNNVVFDGDLKNSVFNISDLKAFTSSINSQADVKINKVKFTGVINDLILRDSDLKVGDFTRFKNDLHLVDVMEGKAYSLYTSNGDLSVNSKDLTYLLPEYSASFENIKSFSTLKFKGRAEVDSLHILAKGDLQTVFGDLQTDIILDNYTNDSIYYKGNIASDNFKLGEFIGVKDLKSLSIKSDFEGKGKTLESLKLDTQTSIKDLVYGKYHINDLAIDGVISDKVFDGNISIADELATLDAEGAFSLTNKNIQTKLSANIQEIDLYALGVVKDKNAKIATIIDADLYGANFEELMGEVHLSETIYQNSNTAFSFESISLTSLLEEGGVKSVYINAPEVIDGNITGKFQYAEIGQVAINAVGKMFANFKPKKVSSGQFFDFNFNIEDTFIEMFMPEALVKSGTFISGSVNAETNDLKLTFNSTGFEYKADKFGETKLIVDTENPFIQAALSLENAKVSNYNLKDVKLFTVSTQDTLFIRSSFEGGKKDFTEKYKLKLYQTINPEGELVLGVKKSKIHFNHTDWVFNPEDHNESIILADLKNKQYKLSNLKVRSEEQEAEVSAIYNNLEDWSVDAKVSSLDLEKLIPPMGKVVLKGLVDGNIHVAKQGERIKPDADLQVNNFALNDYLLGNIISKINWDDLENKYGMNVHLHKDQAKILGLKGYIEANGEKPTIDATLSLNKLDLSPLNVFLTGVLDRIRGSLTGDLQLTGDLTDPDYNGILNGEKAGFRVEYLNTDYSFADIVPIPISKGKIEFHNLAFTDQVFDSKGVLNGYLKHNRFLDWYLDLNIDAENLLALNTTRLNGEQYYGKIFAQGLVDIYGPASGLTIDVDAKTLPNSSLVLNLEAPAEIEDNGILRFKEPNFIEDIFSSFDDIYDNLSVTDLTGLSLNLNVDVDDQTEAKIIIDEKMGDVITARGNGEFKMNISTLGKFNMFGEYNISSGDYLFTRGINKKFYLKPNSTIKWNGNPYDADLNISAINTRYVTNIGEFLEMNITRSYNTDISINLFGSISQPNISFGIAIPDAPETIQSALNFRLSTDDAVRNQIYLLLLAGKFNTQNSSFVTSALQTSVYDLVLNQLSRVASNFSESVDVGFDYSAGDNLSGTNDQLNVNLNYRLSDRIKVTGTGGVPISTANSTNNKQDPTGEIEVEYDVTKNKTKKLLLRAFTKPSDIGVDVSATGTDYTSGVGIVYRESFSNFRELKEKILGKSKKQKRAIRDSIYKDSMRIDSINKEMLNRSILEFK